MEPSSVGEAGYKHKRDLIHRFRYDPAARLILIGRWAMSKNALALLNNWVNANAQMLLSKTRFKVLTLFWEKD